ncbi:MAG: TPM domain-containing protein [Lentisphaeria bacterium]|nr:TPM domain-containing protein [Lentisphaeria bacterium]
MAKQKKPVSSAPEKSVYDPVPEYEAKLESPSKPRVRLPRLGCFWIFFLFLFFAGALATGYYHSVGEVPTSFGIPEERVTVSDPEGVLLAEDRMKLEALAEEVSNLADCGVALMFFDERFADPFDVFDEIAADWAPGKGVLLVQDVRGTSVRFGLIGDGWRLADWDPATVRKEAFAYKKTQRGALAVALLSRLKHSIETAAKITAGTEQSGAQSADTSEEQPAGMTPRAADSANPIDEALDKGAEAKAAAAAPDAEPDDEYYDDEYLDDEYYDDEETVGMRAYAEKNKYRTPSGILYSAVTNRGGDGSSMKYALIFLAICGAVAGVSLAEGKLRRKKDLSESRKVLKKYKGQRSNKLLKLVDMNDFDDDGILRNKYLRIAAAVLGVFIGLGFVDSTLSEPPEKDIARIVSSDIPAAPSGDWRIVDKAEVFGADGASKVAAAINRLETRTGGEMMVLTIPTIGMTTIEEFGIETASKWKIGKAGKDNGALLVLAIDDHKSRLEIGYGWEGSVNDARAGDLLRQIVPELQAEQYAEAAVKVVQGVETFVAGAESESRQGAAPKTAYEPQVCEYPAITYLQPKHDPRVLDPADSFWGAVGVFGCLIAVLLAYWGRIIGTSAPRLFIYDPTAVHYSSGGGSDGGSSWSSGSSGSSYSSGGSSGGGGGSFGGGGASGSW